METIIDMIMNGPIGDKLIIGVPVVIALANVVTMLFPSVGTNKFYNMAMKVLNTVSLNIAKNKNADDK